MDTTTKQDNLIYREYAYKSSTPPVLLINSPSNYNVHGKIAPDFSITIVDGLGKYMWYEFLETGASSLPIELKGIHNENVSDTFNQDLWNKHNQNKGDIIIRFYVVNSLGRIGYADVIVRIDINEPPLDTSSFNSTILGFIIQIWMTIFYIFIFFRRYIKKKAESLYFSIFLLFSFLFFFLLISSNNPVKNAQDDLIYDDSLKLSTAPTIQINSPLNYDLYGKIAPNFSITIVDGLGNYSWYEFLETGNSSVPIELNGVLNENVTGIFNQSLWNNLQSNGTTTIRFYANNSLGEVGQADVIVRIDIIDPDINIIHPIGGFFNSTAPEFTVEIEDPNLEKMWYTLNTNSTKYFFENKNNETIDLNAWNFLSEGIVNITFFANDSVSNINSAMTQTNKDISSPTGFIEINSGDTWTNSTSVILSLTYDDVPSGVDKVRYSNNGTSWTAWETPNNTRTWILSSSDGTKTVYYEIRNNAGLITQYNDTIGLDTAYPIGSIAINGGDTWTNSTSVILALTYNDTTSKVDKVRYSNDGTSWTLWETPNNTRAWTLFPVDGIKTVFYEIRDNAGLITQYNDTIGLDEEDPTGFIEINGGDTWTNSTSVILTLSYNDTTSGVDKVRYSNNGTSWTPWKAANDTRTWILSPGDGTKIVYYEIRDNVGFISQYNDTIGLDTMKPQAPINLYATPSTWTNIDNFNLSWVNPFDTSGIVGAYYKLDAL
ncbi:MAG: hypothetical protein ACFFDH_14210, partial [Promethearchaeota archaeon]